MSASLTLAHIKDGAVYRSARLVGLPVCLLLGSVFPAWAATITVTSAGNTTAVDGVVTLREALTSINAAASVNADVAATLVGTYGTSDTIAFNIPGAGVRTITLSIPGGVLPAITRPVTIDGFTQPGSSLNAPLIEVNGTGAPGLASGLNLTDVSNCLIRGLIINRAAGNGIRIAGAGSTGNKIQGNIIGPDATGTTGFFVFGNTQATGVRIEAGATGNIVGTDGDGANDAAERNLISGNTSDGILITGTGTAGNWVAGNLVGTNLTATGTIRNGPSSGTGAGVSLTFGVTNNLIGTNADGVSDAIEANTISGNNGGVGLFQTGTTGNRIQGNFIGTNPLGTAALPNLNDGVTISTGPTGNIVGTNGDGVGDDLEGNVISGNDGIGLRISVGSNNNRVAGNKIGVDVTGMLALGNTFTGVSLESQANANIIGTNGDGVSDALEGNVISATRLGNVAGFGDGVRIAGQATDNNRIAGNRIGTNLSGTAAIANGANGIQIGASAKNNLVGTNGDGASDVLERNLLSGNVLRGVRIVSTGTTGNRIAGNFIGTNADGTAAIPNQSLGIEISNFASTNIVGTNSDGVGDTVEGNTISGNVGQGINTFGAGTNANRIAGNRIGTNAAGTAALPNTSDGIAVATAATNTVIGGALATDANVISGNAGNGLSVFQAGTTGTLIAGNLIGTNAAGLAAIPNAFEGIRITTQATLTSVTRNVISGNTGSGVRFFNAGTSNNALTLNRIGTNSVGAALGNGAYGVYIQDGATGNTVGGPGLGNVIAYNAKGIVVGTNAAEASTVDNVLSQNSIFLNRGLGIDLGDDNVTLNDPGDSDTGPNNLFNFPVISSVLVAGADLVVEGFARPASTIEWFIADLDPTSFGEGRTYLATRIEGSADDQDVTAGSYGPGPVNGTSAGSDTTNRFRFVIPLASLPAAIGVGTLLTATATSPNPSTSEFSGAAPVQLPTDVAIAKTALPVVRAGGILVTEITVTNLSQTTPAASVVVADPTPAGLTFVSNAGGCSTPFPCSLGDLAAGASVQIVSQWQVPPSFPAPSDISNTATVATASIETNTANNSATAVSRVVAIADIAMTKTVDNPTPTIGQEVLFTVTATNLGPNDATGVQVVDQFPVNLTLTTATPSQGTYDPLTGRWEVGALALSQSATLQMRAIVRVPSRLINTATKTAADQLDPDASNNAASATVSPDATADVRVQVVADPDTAAVGATSVITVTACNNGPSPATNIVLQMATSPGAIFNRASHGLFDVPATRWTIPSLAVNECASLVFDVTIATVAPERVTATKIAMTEFDPVLQNDSSAAVINGLLADIQVVKTVDVQRATIGQAVRFTIVATNNGPSIAHSVVLEELLPPALALVRATATQGTFDPATGAWSIGTLTFAGPGSAAILTVDAIVSSLGLIANTASLASLIEPDANPSNNTSTVDLESDALDLAASLDLVGSFAAVDNVIRLLNGITNVSAATSSGRISFILVLPRELEYRSASEDWNCTTIGQTVSCFRDDLALAPGDNVRPVVLATVRGILSEPTYLPLIIANAADVNPANNIAIRRIDATFVIDPADLEVTQSIASTTATVGAPFDVVVNITNHGPDPARHVRVLHVLPTGVVLEAASGSECQGERLVVCDVGVIARDAAAQVRFRLHANLPGFYRLVSTATSFEDDPRLENNQASTGIAVSAASPPTGGPSPGPGLPFGHLDLPSDNATVAGAFAVGGWALDDVGIRHVRIFRDAVGQEPAGALLYVGDAVRIPGARPDVVRGFPGMPEVDRAGWGFLVLTNTLPGNGNGSFRFHAVAEDTDGQQTVLGSRTIVADNASSTKPFGTIDTPGQGETIRGSEYVNFGWALTPAPKSIPRDGSTIVVTVDGRAFGGVAYDNYREDIATLFPGYANASGAIGYRLLDTTTLTAGLHAISWNVSDDAGVTEGIGSRYFIVDNATTQPQTTRPPAREESSAAVATTSVLRQPALIVVNEMQTVNVSVRALDSVDGCASVYEGSEETVQPRGPLPIGSTFDAAAGHFTWQLGPGFIGRYRLVFTRQSCDGSLVTIPVDVVVRRKQ